MTKPTLKVALPDGTTATRQTHRPYTHVVVASYDATVLLQQVRERLEIVARAETQNANPENAGYYAGQAASIRQRIANLEAGPCVLWDVVSWHQGEANAVKGIAQAERYMSPARLEIRILPLA